MNIAIVGCGGFANQYRHIYTQVEGAKLVLMIDPNRRMARTAAAKLGVPRVSTNFEDCLGDDIDMVDISTPNFLHLPQGLRAIEAGKHVIIQKPLTPTVADGQKLVDAAKKTTKNVGMFMNMRSNPLIYDIKDIIDSGAIGKVSSTFSRGAHTGGLRMKEHNWRNSTEKTGGGALIQLGLHHINLVQWLLGEKITSVMAYSKNLMCKNVAGDDVTNAIFEYESGLLGTVESAYCATGGELIINGSEGRIELFPKQVRLNLNRPYKGSFITYTRPKKDRMIPIRFTGRYLFSAENPAEQHVHFVKACLEGKPAPVPIADGLYDLKVVDAIYRAAAEKRQIFVDA